MSDAPQTPPPAPPAASANQLDQLVATAMRRAYERKYGLSASPIGPDELVIAAAAIDAVCQHVRDASLYTATPREIDERVDAAIDVYLSGEDVAAHANALRNALAAVDVPPSAPVVDDGTITWRRGEGWSRADGSRFDAPTPIGGEPTADDTITARVGTDGSYSDVKHVGGR